MRRYRHGELIAEHHVLEDIIPEWDEIAVHVAPLERFFAAQQGQAEPRANQLPESSGQVYA